MRKVWLLGLSATVLGLGVVPASAQPVISAKSGPVTYVLGQVFLDDKQVEIQQGAQFPEVKEKSVLRTTEGRAEVLLPPGVILRLGENSSFRMISNRLIDTRIEMLTGSSVIEADEIAKDTNVTVVCKSGTVSLSKSGIYRFDADPGRVKVFKGMASVQMGDQTLAVSEGKMVNLSGNTATAEKFDVNATDSLDNWSRRRGEEMAMANVSAAKRAHSAPWVTAGNPCMSYYGAGAGTPYTSQGGWGWNPWYGMITYIPCNGPFMSPYGYRYWSPNTVSRLYYQPPPPTFNNGGGFGGYSPSYSTAGATSGGYSGTVASSGVGAASAGAPASSGSTAASAGGGGASHGGGGASGGGHGH